jgi:hypothetical protein
LGCFRRHCQRKQPVGLQQSARRFGGRFRVRHRHRRHQWLADETPGATPAKGIVDARSRGFGLGDPASTAGADAGAFSLFTYVETNRSWGPAPATPVENRLDATLTNVSAARVDLARAALDPGGTLVVATSADSTAALALDGGPFPACSVVLQDGAVLGLLPEPTGVTLPVGVGDHTFTVTCTGTVTRRRLVLARLGGGLDRLVLRGRTATTLGAIGLPGSDLTLALRDGDGDAFTATVPAALLRPSPSGTRLRFGDPSGTLAGGITRLRIGGVGRVDLAVRGRNLNLSAAGAGPVVALLQTQTTTLAGAGRLRARGARLVHP